MATGNYFLILIFNLFQILKDKNTEFLELSEMEKKKLNTC